MQVSLLSYIYLVEFYVIMLCSFIFRF
jgi:hypothetical protein